MQKQTFKIIIQFLLIFCGKGVSISFQVEIVCDAPCNLITNKINNQQLTTGSIAADEKLIHHLSSSYNLIC
jgi:hypothetical protein